MIKHPPSKFLILVLIVATFTLTGCGTDDASIATDPAGIADDEFIPLDTICDLTDEMDGEIVEISGEIIELDDSDPEQLLVGISDGECWIWLEIPAENLAGWSDEQVALLQLENRIRAVGRAYIDGDNRILFDPLPPTLMDDAASGNGEPVSTISDDFERFELCEVETANPGERIQTSGAIIEPPMIEDEGVSFYIVSGGCFAYTWIDNETMDAWQEDERDIIQMGARVLLTGRIETYNEGSEFIVTDVPVVLPAPEVITPCEVTDELLQENIRILGTLYEVLHEPSEGWASWIARDGCGISIWIEEELSQNWDSSFIDLLVSGEQILLEGHLEDDPEGLFLVVEQAPLFPDAEALQQADDIVLPYRLTYTMTDDPNDRWQEVTLTFTTQEGKPAAGLPVSFQQSDLDFIYSASGSAWAAWTDLTGGNWDDTPDAAEQIVRYRALGFNNVEYYPWWGWIKAEPSDNDWQLDLIGDGQFRIPDYFYGQFPEVRYLTFWVGPQFNAPSMVPSFINYRNSDIFRAQFAEYITAAFGKNPSGHFDLYQLALEINDYPAWGTTGWAISQTDWEAAIDFVKWEINLIRQLDPDARISIDFDPTIYFPDKPLAFYTTWLDRLIEDDVAFDVIGLEIHPGSYPGSPNTADALNVMLDELINRYDKDIYIWELAVRSEGTPDQPSFPTDWQAPVSEYTQEFQEALMLASLQALIENPRVIGLRYLVYKDPSNPTEPEWESWRNKGCGLLDEDRNPKLSYESLRSYWQSLFVAGDTITDANGEIQLNVIPGLFSIVIDGVELPTVHLH